eukprot:12607-Rhodomonas_salina.2
MLRCRSSPPRSRSMRCSCSYRASPNSFCCCCDSALTGRPASGPPSSESSPLTIRPGLRRTCPTFNP